MDLKRRIVKKILILAIFTVAIALDYLLWQILPLTKPIIRAHAFLLSTFYALAIPCFIDFIVGIIVVTSTNVLCKRKNANINTEEYSKKCMKRKKIKILGCSILGILAAIGCILINLLVKSESRIIDYVYSFAIIISLGSGINCGFFMIFVGIKYLSKFVKSNRSKHSNSIVSVTANGSQSGNLNDNKSKNIIAIVGLVSSLIQTVLTIVTFCMRLSVL